MSILCKMGFHKWTTREIHQTAPFDDKHYVMAVVIDRCKCGTARFAIGGSDRPTCWITPDKYKESLKRADSVGIATLRY